MKLQIHVVFCVVSRYPGGAFVVFSGALNDNMQVIAVEGSFTSVIGGAPAAATVFARDVSARTGADPRVAELEAALESAEGDERARLRVALADARTAARSDKLGEVAAEFVPSTPSSARSGSVRSTRSSRLRPHLIEALERGMRRTLRAGIV